MRVLTSGSFKQVYSGRIVVGQHAVHDETSENGLILCQFAEANELIISSTCFEHKNVHKGTWNDPAGRTVNQIDHVLINK